VQLDRQDPDEPARHPAIEARAAPAPLDLLSYRADPVTTSEPPAPLQADLVESFVGNAHGDLDATRAALEQHPTLVNAAWDWGGGDWETALGAAGHMGRRDIAELLLAHGARLDLFVAAMLGETEVVRAMLSAHPELRDAAGPHGIPLRAHAEAGGEAAREVVALLDDLGG
jgi:hypothetical protein